MKFKVLLTAPLLFLTFSQPLFANGLSLGLIAGQSSTELATDSCESDRDFIAVGNSGLPLSCNVDDSDSSIGIHLSYHFNDMWSLELGYIDLGQTSSFVTTDFPGSFFDVTGTNQTPPETIESSVIYFAGNVSFPLAENWSLTGRLGIGRVETDLVSRLFEVEINNDDPTLMLGASLDYNLTSAWSVHLRYDHFPFDYSYSDRSVDFEIDSSIDLASLGITYKF